ncbi:unnamed protein product [Adineta steineri]|uniref:Ketosynthase family 3 (KS3) domain-containing protein n=1 Tax=Adineta steineri TaxID=433720 RepID=A0A818UI49_9BILA|nr:unnamed protein product [Adineta steineri]
MSTSDNLLEPMAIVGIACEFAGDIHSATDLWQELQDNRDVSSATPRDRVHFWIIFSHNGNEDKTNFVVPSAVGQIRLLTNIYSRINFDAQRIFYIEAHSTGTPVGDPIEANCSDPFFNQSSLGPSLLIDSAKSNLGYTEGTAGVASLIKVAMCMYH